MDVTPLVRGLGREIEALARTDGEDAGAGARRESAIRRTVCDALAAAADEIDRGLTQGSVEVRFQGDEAHFVVTPPSPERSSGTAAGSGAPPADGDATPPAGARTSPPTRAGGGQAAGHEGSLVDEPSGQLASAMVRQGRAPRTAGRSGKRGRQRYSAWVR